MFARKINGEWLVCCRGKSQSKNRGKRTKTGRIKAGENIRRGYLVKFNKGNGFFPFGNNCKVLLPKEFLGKRIKVVIKEMEKGDKLTDWGRND